MQLQRLLTRSTLVAFIAILLRMLGAPWARAKEVARLTKQQDMDGALLFTLMLIDYLIAGARLRASHENEAIGLKRLDMLAAFARDYRGAAKDAAKHSRNIRARMMVGEGHARPASQSEAINKDARIPHRFATAQHFNTS